MKKETNKYLFFYKDAEEAENKYIECHRDKNCPDCLPKIRKEFQNF